MTAQTIAALAIELGPNGAGALRVVQRPAPTLAPDQVEVAVIRAGFCGTDREIIEGHIGRAPNGAVDLVLGHEVFGRVVARGADTREFDIGDLVAATARRGCGCDACRAGEADFCSALQYQERGILGLDGYFAERFVEREAHLIRVPPEIAASGVLVEPLSVAEKAIRIATAVQRRMSSWRPRTAVVYGAGPIGLLATMALRARDIGVWTLDLRPAPNPASAIVGSCGATYHGTAGSNVDELRAALPSVDLIVECTGSSLAVADAMRLLGNNGVLVLQSVTGGSRQVSLPLDRINLEFVLGNKLMVGAVNSSIADFRAAIGDLQAFDRLWPGLAESLITHRIQGLDAASALPGAAAGAVKAVIEIGS